MENTTYKGEKRKPIDPIGTLFRHWRKILLGGVLTLLLLLFFVKKISKTYFEAEGKIRIEPVITSFIGAKDSIVNQYGKYVGTEIFKIHNIEIVESAVKNLPEKLQNIFLPMESKRDKALDILMKNIKVEQIRNTHLIRIFLLGEMPDGLAELINIIMETYLEKGREEAVSKNKRQMDYLMSEKNRITLKVTTLAKELHELAGKAGMSTFSEQFNPLNRGLGDLQEAFVRAYGAMVEKNNTLIAVKDEIRRLKEIPLIAEIDEMVEKDQSLWNTSTKTFNDLQDMRASLDGLSADNPEHRIIEAQMERKKIQLEDLRKSVRARITKVVHARRDAKLQRKLIMAQSEYESASKTAKEMRKELKRTQTKASKVSQLILLGQDIERELKLFQETLVQLNERIQNLQADSLAPGRAFLASYAQTPNAPSNSNLKKILAIAFIFSFGWITTTCLAFDLADSRIRSSKDMQNALGFPPSVTIQHLQGENFSRITLDHPESKAAGAIRMLAVRLNKERMTRKIKFAVCTSVNAADSGVSEIILNTANALRELGVKVLVLELNLSTPAFAQTIPVPESFLRLHELLDDKNPDNTSFFYDQERKIYILPAGNTKTISNSKITMIIDDLANQFDFVLIDTMPILKSALTEFLIGKADAGVLVVHTDRSLYTEVRQAAEMMETLEIGALATVLNSAQAKRSRRNN